MVAGLALAAVFAGGRAAGPAQKGEPRRPAGPDLGGVPRAGGRGARAAADGHPAHADRAAALRHVAAPAAERGRQTATAAAATPPAAGPSGDSDGRPARREWPPSGRPERSEPRFGVVEGRVKVPGGDTSELYVYVDNFRGPPVRGKAVEIKQENKQFIPRVQVVPVGTTVSFPNLDPIFHNVFSNSPRNGFDLGSYRAGDRPGRRCSTPPGWWTSTATSTSA